MHKMHKKRTIIEKPKNYDAYYPNCHEGILFSYLSLSLQCRFQTIQFHAKLMFYQDELVGCLQNDQIVVQRDKSTDFSGMAILLVTGRYPYKHTYVLIVAYYTTRAEI